MTPTAEDLAVLKTNLMARKRSLRVLETALRTGRRALPVTTRESV
ncbi:hypothetical protein ACFQV2_06540 [Actinokineospora soli]|uniref:Uncharacterized protein n=1 Tax=Actinokineospora soli TaxID=1048753 RepID=A0ABW2THY6_9PSEU